MKHYAISGTGSIGCLLGGYLRVPARKRGVPA